MIIEVVLSNFQLTVMPIGLSFMIILQRNFEFRYVIFILFLLDFIQPRK